MQKVKDAENLVKGNPDIGLLDPLFAGRKRPYRSVIIYGLSKMVYFADENTIYIAAFWDTRKEPIRQAQQVNDKF